MYVLILIILLIIFNISFSSHMKKERAKERDIATGRDKLLRGEITEEEYYENLQKNAKEVFCPKCGSKQIQVTNRGWKATTGLIGSGNVERVCISCLHRW